MNESNLEYILKLEELANNVPPFEELIKALGTTTALYNTDGDPSLGEFICHDDDCAIMRFSATGNVTFPIHTHDEFEYIIVLEGYGFVTVEGSTKPFGPRDCIMFKPMTRHSWVFSVPTRLIVITIPASKGFPSGES